MSYTGFGVSSGPSAPPKFQPSFPSTPPSPVAATPSFPRQQSSPPRKGGILEIKESPPFLFQNTRPVVNPPFSSDGNVSTFKISSLTRSQVPRRTDQRWNTEQKAPPKFQPTFPSTPPAPSPPFGGSPAFPHQQSSPRKVETPEIKQSPPFVFQNARSVVNPPFSYDGNVRRTDQRWNTEQKAVPNYNNAQMLQRPSAITQFSASSNFRPGIHAKSPQVQDLKRTRSPDNNFRNISQDVNGRPRSPLDYSDLLTSEEPSPVSPFADPRESQKGYPTEQVGGVLKRTRSPSPPLPFASGTLKDSRFAGDATKRPSMSPPIQATRSNVQFHTPGSDNNQIFPLSMHNGGSEASASFPAIKRTRSPPLSLSDQVVQGTSNSTQDETEREMQAKAKRAARFRVELSQPMPEAASQKFLGNRHDHSMVEKRKDVEQSKETVGDIPSGSALPEYEDSEASTVIVGLCPDMCPETERAERERKGDLDHYERVGGDRNQTCKSMAVKKYNRTAEREAGLIRPMPILRNTIDYLLNLLDQPYDDKFLGMYNFLWDRMRAIRMDLRMQHIFNLGAVAMLEQMIRLHIIAMHELCEYTKGEGFSEGFDAHLNIEQMNKTSVELFQMYDDHRKKGINIPTEKEFRGYYALLKLDKHPGYRVEPAELSLDLAKMTPEIRQTPEVLFARDVARACRTGNFIAFFRLARRASYLQACLMHAHFSKLRTQALASLHSGLQNNQGLPVSNVSKWLAVEEDDIQSLSDYHGFLLRDFEEPYMVKEGPFLNSEKDYATNRSTLVQLKRSRTISEDVASSSQEVSLPAEKERKPQLAVGYKQNSPTDIVVKTPSPTFVSDEHMLDSPIVPSPKDRMRMQPVPAPTFIQQTQSGHQMTNVGFPTWNLFQAGAPPHRQSVKVDTLEKQNLEAPVESPRNRSLYSDAKPLSLPISPVRNLQELSPVLSNWQELSPVPKFDIAVNTVSQNVVEDLEDEEPVDIHQEPEPDKAIEVYHEKEAAEGKLRLILRIWRRHASKKKELRMRRLLAANAAMNSLSLGPLIRQNRDDPNTFGEFNIDNVMWERYNKHGRSWSRLNVSDVVVDQLSERNPEAKCICFKILLCSDIDDTDRRASSVTASASSWLHSKFMPGKEDPHYGLVKSSPGLSIWKKWRGDQYSTDLTCCLSVIKDVKFDILNETILGASAILYLVSESISWELQKTRLQSLVMSIPSYSRLPLLVLTNSHNWASTADLLIDKLGLSNFDDTRISGIRVLPVVEDLQAGRLDGFFSDKQLREGLQWLARESPQQPALNHVKTRELVMTQLNSLLESLDEMNAYEVGPNHCISALNEALDRAISEVTEAANLNPSSWPCPEINLLDEASAEHKAYKKHLPNIGWSSPAKIEPLVCALKESKLPGFSYDISWLGQGSVTGEEIVAQRSQLESCILRYLTESSKMMDSTLAANEARVMLQKNAMLELHNSTYYIIPQWVMIFRRIFNWRLSHLAHGVFSSAYVTKPEGDGDTHPISGFAVNSKHETTSISSSYNLSHPSLDEMVDLSFNPVSSKSSQPKMVLKPDKTPSKPMVNEVNERLSRQNGGQRVNEGEKLSSWAVLNVATESRAPAIAMEEGDKLSKLLENCNTLQNLIERKLSIYF